MSGRDSAAPELVRQKSDLILTKLKLMCMRQELSDEPGKDQSRSSMTDRQITNLNGTGVFFA